MTNESITFDELPTQPARVCLCPFVSDAQRSFRAWVLRCARGLFNYTHNLHKEKHKMKTYQRLPIRHGDLALIPIERITEGLKPSKEKVLLRGSNNNPHSITAGTFYPDPKGDFRLGELLADSTTLTHVDHGEKGRGELRTAPVPDGAWEAQRQVEVTHEGMRKVED